MYERNIATMKWQSKLHDNLFNEEKIGNLDKGKASEIWNSVQSFLNQSKVGDYYDQRRKVQSISDAIKTYGGENKDEILRNLGVDLSKKYGYAAAHPDKTNALDDLSVSGKLNSSELAAWQFFEDIYPEQLGKYKAALLPESQIKDNYEAS